MCHSAYATYNRTFTFNLLVAVVCLSYVSPPCDYKFTLVVGLLTKFSPTLDFIGHLHVFVPINCTDLIGQNVKQFSKLCSASKPEINARRNCSV